MSLIFVHDIIMQIHKLNGGPEGWDFSGTTEHQWLILFLIYHDRTVQYCMISGGYVTEVDVYSQLGHGDFHKGVCALRGYFGPLWDQKMKIAFHKFLLISLLEQ